MEDTFDGVREEMMTLIGFMMFINTERTADSIRGLDALIILIGILFSIAIDIGVIRLLWVL